MSGWWDTLKHGRVDKPETFQTYEEPERLWNQYYCSACGSELKWETVPYPAVYNSQTGEIQFEAGSTEFLSCPNKENVGREHDTRVATKSTYNGKIEVHSVPRPTSMMTVAYSSWGYTPTREIGSM